MKRQLKKLLYPWWALALPRRHGQHPYFGPPTLPYGGPDLKARKLKARFGNAAWPTLAYVFSAKPPPAAFLRGLRRRKIPIVLNQNGVFYPAWDPVHYERNNQRLRELHEAADYVLYQSQFCFDSTQEWVRPPERPHRILYNAVDVQLFKPREKISAGLPPGGDASFSEGRRAGPPAHRRQDRGVSRAKIAFRDRGGRSFRAKRGAGRLSAGGRASAPNAARCLPDQRIGSDGLWSAGSL